MSKSTKTAKAITPAKVAVEAAVVSAQPVPIAETVAPVGVKKVEAVVTKAPANFKKIRGGQVYELNTLGPRTLHFSEVGKIVDGKKVSSTIMLKIFTEGKLTKVLFLGKNAEKMSSWISEALDFNREETPYTNIEQG